MDNQLTVFLVASPHIKMEILPPSMIGCISMCELCKKRAWIFRQRMKFQLVYNPTDSLIVRKGQMVRYDTQSSSCVPRIGNLRDRSRSKEAALLLAQID